MPKRLHQGGSVRHRTDERDGRQDPDRGQRGRGHRLHDGRCTVVAWYPITPSSSLCESLIGYMKKYRVDKETGKATFAIVQAEDEIASLGMVIGASWAGARAMTATAGPGIS
jgi:2-oxoglutarate ferredoxin oxidoreductase subunit alpha